MFESFLGETEASDKARKLFDRIHSDRQMAGIITFFGADDFEKRDQLTVSDIDSFLERYPTEESFRAVAGRLVYRAGDESSGQPTAEKQAEYRVAAERLIKLVYPKPLSLIKKDAEAARTPRRVNRTPRNEPTKERERGLDISFPIKKAKNLNELYSTLNRIGGLTGSKRSYSANELGEIIEQVRMGRTSINDVTRSGGLRRKVRSLLNIQK
jgi:hypothetical protein